MFLKGPLFKVRIVPRTTLLLFPSKANLSILYTVYLYAVWHVILLVYDVQYVTISMCRLGGGKTIKKVIKYMKMFGTLVLCYEFGWFLAGLQARRQIFRVKIVRNTMFTVL